MESSGKTSTPPSKQCSQCRQLKPRSEFYTDKRHSNGLYSCCRSCHVAITNSYRVRHRDYYAQLETEAYHKIQDEAGCHSGTRAFYPGFRLLRALASAPIVEI